MADLREIAGQAADKYGIDRNVFFALIQQESGWNPRATSPAGAIGLGQLMPGTARDLGVDPYDPVQNLDGAARYLSQQLKTFGGYSMALAAYNAGPGNVQKYGGIPPFAETQNYVNTVLGNARSNDTGSGRLNLAVETDSGGGGSSSATSTGGSGLREVTLPSGRVQVVDEYGDIIDSYWPSAGDPSSSRGPDHFFDVSPVDKFNMDDADRTFGLDEDKFEHDKGQDAIANQRADAEERRLQSTADRDYALAQGDYDLARQKQDDANYWQGISTDLEQQRVNLTNQGQQLEYSAAMAGIEQQKQRAANDYQVGMANATNDAEQNVVQDRWNQQQAHIAQMEDETRRLLGGQQNQTAQFGAETDRAARMGQLALDNNKFIHDQSMNPRGLPGLFMMQRGLAPDWDTMAAGGTPATGTALAPADVMGAYKPVTAAASGFNLPASSLPIVSGNNARGAAGNSFIQQNQPGTGSAGGGSAAPATPSFIPMGASKPVYAPPSASAPDRMDRNAGQGASGNGVPLASLRPGMNFTTVGGDTAGSDFTMPAYYDEGKTRAVQPGDTVTGGTQVWIDYLPKMADGGMTNARMFVTGDAPGTNPQRGGARPEVIHNPTGAPIGVTPNPASLAEAGRAPVAPGGQPPQQPPNGYARSGIQSKVASQRMAAPAASPAMAGPTAYARADVPPLTMAQGPSVPQMQPMPGARPDLGIDPNQMRRDNRWVEPQAQPAPDPMNRPLGQAWDTSRMGGGNIDRMRMLADFGLNPGPGALYGQRQQGGAKPMVGNRTAPSSLGMPSSSVSIDSTVRAPGSPFDLMGDMRNREVAMNRESELTAAALGMGGASGGDYWRNLMGMPRFALGTGQAAYNAAGMGGAWVPDSNNDYLNGIDLPTRLQMLDNYKMPISPGVAAGATGRTAGPLNVGAAVTQGRQAGVLPSLQTLARQTKNETEATRGYFEGVAGVPWSDIVDWLAKPTETLGAAVSARGV